MSDINHQTIGVEEVDDELVVVCKEVDDTLTTIIQPDSFTTSPTSIFTIINRGVGYVWAGAFNIVKDIIFYKYRKTKGGRIRITKSGAKRITSREIQ